MERHSRASDGEKAEAHRRAAAIGTPRLPWGLEAYAAYLIWGRNDPVGGRDICRLGMELFSDYQAPFRLLLAQQAFRDRDFVTSLDLLSAVSTQKANELELDRMVLGLSLFYIESSPEKLLEVRDQWAEALPDSAALPYIGAFATFIKEGTNAYMRGQKENWRAWFDRGSGDPRQALLYARFARAVGEQWSDGS